jgi:hypothetical protein
MAKEAHRAESSGRPVEEIPLDRAFLDIPDEGNIAIEDARRTYWVTVASAVVFVAVIFFFILL